MFTDILLFPFPVPILGSIDFIEVFIDNVWFVFQCQSRGSKIRFKIGPKGITRTQRIIRLEGVPAEPPSSTLFYESY